MTDRYTLWLMPPPEIGERYARLIEALAARLGTPRFPPHITLTGRAGMPETEVITRIERLAARLAPVPVQLTEVGVTDQYFRCLFVYAARTPELLDAQRAACTALDQPADPDFMPHLSLVYGDLPQARKNEVLAEIGRDFAERFIAPRLALYAPVGDPETWRCRREFALGSRP